MRWSGRLSAVGTLKAGVSYVNLGYNVYMHCVEFGSTCTGVGIRIIGLFSTCTINLRARGFKITMHRYSPHFLHQPLDSVLNSPRKSNIKNTQHHLPLKYRINSYCGLRKRFLDLGLSDFRKWRRFGRRDFWLRKHQSAQLAPNSDTHQSVSFVVLNGGSGVESVWLWLFFSGRRIAECEKVLDGWEGCCIWRKVPILVQCSCKQVSEAIYRKGREIELAGVCIKERRKGLRKWSLGLHPASAQPSPPKIPASR
jgi:hypothetical protein